MKKIIQQHIGLCILVACLVLASLFVVGRINGLVYGGMFGGRVLDQETKQPVPGAYVIATWDDYTLNRTTCVHMDIDITDEEGSYFFGPWVDMMGRVVMSQDSSKILVYAPGYKQVTYASPIYVREHGDSPKERIKELRHISSLFCGDISKEGRKLVDRVYREMYYEAEPLLKEITEDPKGMYRLRVEAIKNDCGSLCE